MYKFSLVLLAICLQASSVRISEVMSNPQGSEYENEFIELFNRSDHVMQINGWILSDGTGIDTLIHWFGPEAMKSQGYALILDPGYNYELGPYTDLIPDSIPVYTISTDASFGSGGLSNSGESVIIRNQDSSSLTQMSWTRASENGYSWERASVDSTDSVAIWVQSLNVNGTPGFRNSVMPPPWNLALNKAEVSRAVIGEPIELELTLKNTGEHEITDFSVFITYDENQNNEFENDEWNDFKTYTQTIESQGTLVLPIQIFDLQPGVHKLAVHVFTLHDDGADDNSKWVEVAGLTPVNAVSISEIMHSPTSEQQGEWIELKNISRVPVSLQGWTLSDANQTRHLITDQLLYLQPESLITLTGEVAIGEYFSLAPEQMIILNSWPTLNSSSDSVRIYDATDHSVAKAFYRGSWGDVGASLERRHLELRPFESDNWLPCIDPDGGTPSQVNGQQLTHLALRIEHVNVNMISSVGPAPVSVTILFSNQGLDTIRSLQAEAGVSVSWEGILTSFMSDSLVFLSDDIPPGFSDFPIRIFQGVVCLADTSVQIILGFPAGQIALNEIHYLPSEDQEEYLELINISSVPLCLEGWQFEDRSGTKGFIESQMTVPEGGLAVLCKDAAIMSDWINNGTPVLEVNPWPSLNNTSDSILIFDPLDRRQLSLGYDADWGGDIGKSMERLALWKHVEASTSWATCLDSTGITPGRLNSVQVPEVNVMLDKLSVLDSILFVDEQFTLQLAVTNAGREVIQGADIEVQVIQTNQTVFESRSELVPIEAGDTLRLPLDLKLDHCGWFDVLAQVYLPSDGLLSDNQCVTRVYLSCLSSPLIVNEVMPVPATEEGEWIEIYNRSDRSVDIDNWRLSDNSLSEKIIIDSTCIIPADDYLILTAVGFGEQWLSSVTNQEVPSFPTLNNTEDQVILYDPQGFQVDDLSWTEFTSMVEGRSLERIRSDYPGSDPRNWGLCLDETGSTAGRENSLDLDMLPKQLSISLSPNPFSPDGDGMADDLVIYFELPFEQGVLSMMIFDMAGRKIAEPVLVKPIGHRGQCIWQGDANYGGKAVTGLYIMKLLIDDLSGHVYEVLKKIYIVR